MIAKPWAVARVFYGEPWFVASIKEGPEPRPSWTPNECDALRFDGPAGIEAQLAVAEQCGVPCFLAREGQAAVWSTFPQGHA